MAVFIRLEFAILVCNENMLFAGSVILQNPERLNSIGRMCCNLYEIKVTATDLVTEHKFFTSISSMMRLLCGVSNLAIVFNLKRARRAICQHICIV